MDTVISNTTPCAVSSHKATEHMFTLSERIAWLEKHGKHCMSYSTLQPNMRYFDLKDVGFISYQDWLGQRVVLSDPICAPHLYPHLIGQFLASSPKNVSFVQISQDVAQVLARSFDMYTTEFGQETRINLAQWNLKGKKKQIFRTALNTAEKQEITFKESIKHPENSFNHAQDQDISDTWLSTRRCKKKEIGFLIRPKDMPYKKDVRCFYGYQGDNPIGFVHFDPIYQENNVVGYVPNISRANPYFKQGLFYAIMATALEQFKNEGIQFINLGLSPLHLNDHDTPTLKSSAILTRLLKLTHRLGHRVYNFNGIQFTKQRFRGEEQPSYVASHQALPLKAFMACLRLSKVL